jgi:NADH dehydrogenase FAD-containing subunit
MTHRVLVLGAGYAGLPAAKRLARQVRPDEVEVTLVSGAADFLERPRLHQLATGQRLGRVSLSEVLHGSGVRLVVGRVARVDVAARTVTLHRARAERTLDYDTLVYALGSNVDEDAVPGIREHACTLSGTAAASRLGERLRAVAQAHGTVVVCGGGLTGIEAAAEVAESFPDARVHLVSASVPGGRLSDVGRAYLGSVLDDLGVEVSSGARVTAVEAGRLRLAGGPARGFDLCVWAGGFSVPALARDSGLAVRADGRALVDETLRSTSHPEVYVIGDAAAAAGPWGDALAMGCRSGGFTGPYVADTIARRLTGREVTPFRFRYFHECISLGRRRGLVQFLNADESPKARALTGRRAVLYKNATLRGAVLLFRWPGPYLTRRRHLVPEERPVLVSFSGR